MKVNELIDELIEFIVSKYEIFIGIEEMKTLGYNIINLLLDLGQDIEYAAVSFRYMVSIDELEPIAVVIHPKKDKTRKLDFDMVLQILRRYGGYIYGSQEDVGFLLPLQEGAVLHVLRNVIPDIIEQIFGYKVKPLIIGYTLDVYHNNLPLYL